VARYEVARIDELDEIPVGHTGLLWRPIRRRFGIEAFGINAYTCRDAGDEVVEAHDELGAGAGHHEELYVVVRGHATFTLDGEEIDAPVGTLVFAKDPAVKRSAVAREAGTTVLAIGGETGAYTPSPWEHYFAAIPLVQRGDYAGAVALCEQGLELHPGNGPLLYNLACYRSLAGDLDGALSTLRQALAAEPQARVWARTDPDFAALRERPDVAALLAES
jgi:tetratricopeptide (TPR) repeat protein